MIKNIISECKTDLRYHIDKGLIWELTKLNIRSVSIPYCIKKKTAFKNNLEKEITLIQSELDSNPSHINLERFNTAKNELEQIDKHEIDGLMPNDLRKVKKTLFFLLNLEEKKHCNKLITNLEVDGKIIKEQRNIAEAQTNFFHNLYSEKLNISHETYKNSLNDFLINNKISKLSNAKKKSCEQRIVDKEIIEALKQLHNGKTPGTDGLPQIFTIFGGMTSKHY